MTIQELIEFLQELPEEDKQKELCCVAIAGIPKGKLRVVSMYPSGVPVCLDEK